MASLGSSPLNLTATSGQSASNNIGPYTSTIDEKTSIAPFIKSLFNESTSFALMPQGDINNDQEPSATGRLHDKNTYDTSVQSIVDYTSQPKLAAMKLTLSDFAFLKYLGVYPNNRLVVARRFPTGVGDDLTSLGNNTKPLATILSWIPEGTDFMKFSFGEEWVSSEASFVSILNDIGSEVYQGDNNLSKFGADTMKSAANLVPLPGMMESLQYRVFKKMGISDVDAANLPYGNPNLIRQAMQRKTIGNEADSGLNSDFTISVETEYEQKFINDIDPTIVFFDILSNIITFGTSESEFQFNGTFKGKVSEFVKGLTSGTVSGFKKSVILFVSTVADAIKDIGKGIVASIASGAKKIASDDANLVSQVFDNVANQVVKLVQSIINKYKVKIMGVTNALTGGPSTPWHVTIGNPKRPLFSSGDMLVQNVDVTMGDKLSFNDLPSSIKVKFTMKSARSLGAQEIYRKFNTGRGRTYKKLDNGYSFLDSKIYASDKEINQVIQDQKDADIADLNAQRDKAFDDYQARTAVAKQQQDKANAQKALGNIVSTATNLNNNLQRK